VGEALGESARGLVVCGHIHVQYDRAVDARRLVNAGSVGRPNERPPAAYWALLGGADGPVLLLRTDYDVERAVAAAAAAGYPSDDLAAALREPPSAEETIAFFERARGA
jgi:diadenosine tetraphosphatase ApaH/serine/threonine PP2A family protein phosphatase